MLFPPFLCYNKTMKRKQMENGMDIEQILKNMTIEEKIAFCSGADFWHTKEMKHYEIPSIMMSDGPHGLRKQPETADMLGINESVPATSFPTAVLSACSWDKELLKREGEAIAREAIANKVSLVLGPGANIKRNPLCGRNFEYFSEDPYLSGKLAAAHISGIEKTGTGSSLKHFALNNQEYKRFSSDSLVDERTMREIYLASFEIAVKEGKPSTIMSSYNKINGVYSSDNHWLLTELLREEWGFDGLVVTDWGGMSDRIEGFKAGCDLMMPGGSDYMEKEVLEEIKNGKLSEETINLSVRRVLELIAKTQREDYTPADLQKHYALAKEIAQESAVLLKNENACLPLKKEENILFVGPMAKQIRYQGSGSSHINPWKLVNVTDACPEIFFVEGCKEDGSSDEKLIGNAAEAAKKAEKVVIFAGLTDIYESEGFDRESTKMPEGHIELIEKLSEVNENVIVVLMCGSAIEVPWIDRVSAVLYAGLPGEAGGEAIADILYGKVNPSGKLAESWPMVYEDCICKEYYGKPHKNAQYREGIYVGYRYYETAGIEVRFPFGYGLSYTQFDYSDLRIERNKVSCTVKNIGTVPGKEIVQLYIEPVNSMVHRPVRELKGFEKVTLEPGESKRVSFVVSDRSFAVWSDGWKAPEGYYNICIGRNCHEMCLIEEILKDGAVVEEKENLPEWYQTLDGIPSQKDFESLLGRKIVEKTLKKGEFTKENTVMEMKEHSFLMKLVYKGFEAVMARKYGGRDYSNPTFLMMMTTAMDCSVSGMQINGGIKGNLLMGLVEIANGHILKGIRLMLKK